MSCKRWIGVLAALAAIAALPAIGAADDDDDDEKRVTITGGVRARWESVSNVMDIQDDDLDPALNDDFSFFPYRARLAINGRFSRSVRGSIEVQGIGFFGDEAPEKSAADPVNQATAGFEDADSSIDLYQAYIELRDLGESDWALRIGRQEHTLGAELHLGDQDFYNGTSFDGIRAGSSYKHFDVDLFAYTVAEIDLLQQGGVPFGGALGGTTGGVSNDDVTFTGTTFHVALTDTGQGIEPYLLYLRDGDTSPGAGGVKLYTFGARYARAVESEEDADDNPFDWHAELALQAGDYEGGTGDLGGHIFEGWFGYNWGDGALHRLHVGLLTASGDDDPADDDIDSYVPLFPDIHAHNRLGDLDLFGGLNAVSTQTIGPVTGLFGMTNVTDLNVGYTGSYGKHAVLAALHGLRLTEADQLAPALVAIGGPGFAAIGDNEIGLEIDGAYSFRYSRNLDFRAGIAYLSAGGVLDEMARALYGEDADDVYRLWGQIQLEW